MKTIADAIKNGFAIRGLHVIPPAGKTGIVSHENEYQLIVLEDKRTYLPEELLIAADQSWEKTMDTLQAILHLVENPNKIDIETDEWTLAGRFNAVREICSDLNKKWSVGEVDSLLRKAADY